MNGLWDSGEATTADVLNAVCNRTHPPRIEGKGFLLVTRMPHQVWFFPSNFRSHMPHPATNEKSAKLFIDLLICVDYARYWKRFLPLQASVRVPDCPR